MTVDTASMFRQLKSKNTKARKKIEALTRNSPIKNRRIWGVCNYLKHSEGVSEDCSRCSEWENDKVVGIGQRMCYGLAEECLKIATGEWPVDEQGFVIRKYISRNCKSANLNKKPKK